MLSDAAGEASARKLDVRTMCEQLLAGASLLAASALLAVMAVLTWILVGRPLLFRQERAGLRGIPFTILKFRTMSNVVDSAGLPLPDAQRTGPIARFLRRIRLDELPQLLSIARGEMAFIGPRPLLPETIQEMGNWGLARCRVRPGLTGWSQVNGNTLLSNEQKLAMDLWYVENQSLKLDILIAWRTLVTVMLGERIDAGNLASALAYARKLGINGGVQTGG
jgi:lipopolysaccharide/colanic/teichoic acid biosynthesis glycosyltransferase